MTKHEVSFEIANLSRKVDEQISEFINILENEDASEIRSIYQKFLDDLQEFRQREEISVAFIGQYNAGKSTTISALTGRRDIRIDSDVATDQSTTYYWNGISLIDTPGLFADRSDHDDITYHAIENADLLVFCLTYMLFDEVTASNFKKLAYERGYRSKMMLLVNKMSDEAGEQETKEANYRESLAKALMPYSLDEFTVCFVDAKDYCDGVDDEDELLKEISYFSSFISALNNFVKSKGLFSKLDTPVRISLSALDQVRNSIVRNNVEDATFFEILARVKRRLDKERQRFQTFVDEIVNEMNAKIVLKGEDLSEKIENLKNKEELEKEIEALKRCISEVLRDSVKELQNAMKTTSNELNDALAEVEHSTLFEAFVDKIDNEESVDSLRIQAQLDEFKEFKGWMATIAAGLGVALIDALDVVVVDSIFSGVDLVFSGIFDLLGDILAVPLIIGGLFMLFNNNEKRRERENQINIVKSEIKSKVESIAFEAEQKVRQLSKEFESKAFDKIEENLAQIRQNEERAIVGSSEKTEKLLAIENNFKSLIKEIYLAGKSFSIGQVS